ncbi:hypothetical protein JDV02_010220 [Purpureocillium takamizusanense]|nr:uncharacterized protein JDV02_010220 [Purpureocillium takamizusanense]UNI24480.1 hypothetical protein JDV02_010220 [Purpureocillium takamizusanense]
MLPAALQMHTRPEPPPPAFDTFSGTIDYDAQEHDLRPLEGIAASHRRSFPIRITQTHLHPYPHDHQSAKPPPVLELPEYKLRRKTPSGTVDAAYDGSPVQPVPGPPPFKQMILPVTGTTRQRAPAHAGQYPSRPSWTAGHVPRGHEHDPAVPPWAMHIPQAQFAFSHAQGIDHRPTQLSLNHNPAPFRMEVQQPVLRANEYNVRAICPPPFPINGSFPFGHIAWQPGSSPWAYRGFDQSPAMTLNHGPPKIVSDGRPVLYDLTGHSAPGCWAGPSNPHRGSEPIVYDTSTWNVNQAPFLARTPLSTAPSNAPGFKEKALSHAHQSYVDLLAFLQASGRANPLKTTSGHGAPHRLSVYPRPRKPVIRSSWDHRLSGGTTTDFRGFPTSDGIIGSSRPGDHPMPTLENCAGSSPPGGHVVPSPSLDLSGGAQLFSPGQQAPASYYSSFAGASPADNARASAEILESLCEQSGWKWVDGMLLGGCLHYGLERYEEALTWFSRIIATNPSHVEAITNTAATLYCLNRQDEAERHWLKAVELRPSYLEATEHLVGLLYKKRSEEAVDIITHVQRALKLVPPSVGDETSSWGQGYGSSGYALPGAENGRILALVHAKGTMLYSLKNTEKAAEAFEEAVLISAGRNLTGIQDLIRKIQSSLSPDSGDSATAKQVDQSLRPLMLPPERARRTAQLVFSGGGELPGLTSMRNGPARRAAVQTTSNSLLSLAKIFQDAMSSGSASPGILRRSSSVGDILALYYLSLSLQESPSTANNVGILLAGVQQVAAPFSRAASRDPSTPGVPGISPGSGMALALAYYNYGLRLDPKHVHLHTNLGSLLKDIGQLDLAIQMYERAVSCDGTFDIALTNLANAVKDKGRINDAISYYRRAVASNPNFAEAVCGLLTALNSVCNWRGRGGVILDGGKYDRWHVDDDGKLLDSNASGRGFGLTKRVVDIVKQQLRDSACWGRHTLQGSAPSALAAELQRHCSDPSFKLREALNSWAGQPWEGSRVLRLVERSTRVILREWYLDRYVAKREVRSSYSRPRLPPSLTVPSAPTVLPFHTFTCPLTAGDIRAISQRNAMRISCSTLRAPWLPYTVYPPPPPPDPHLNIGYISSDFNNHPLAHL